MVQLVKHDLEYILKQIKIAEQHAAGTPLSELVDNPLLPYGLRTVDGSYNNLVPGREQWGDQPRQRIGGAAGGEGKDKACRARRLG